MQFFQLINLDVYATMNFIFFILAAFINFLSNMRIKHICFKKILFSSVLQLCFFLPPFFFYFFLWWTQSWHQLIWSVLAFPLYKMEQTKYLTYASSSAYLRRGGQKQDFISFLIRLSVLKCQEDGSTLEICKLENIFLNNQNAISVFVWK